MNRQITINGFNHAAICYTEAKGLSKCFDALAEYVGDDSINEIGFNANSGYVYIALENGIEIVSGFANDVEYLVTDQETGEQLFFDTYKEATKKINDIQNH